MKITIWVRFKTFRKMKKLLYLLCLGALTFVACEKELSFVENNEPETVVLTFSSERPQLETTTKTAWDSQAEAIVWTTGDKIRVGYTLNGNWMGQSNPADEEEDPKFYKSEAVSIDGTNSSIGTFKVPMGNEQFINPSPSLGDYQFFSIYPGELRSSSTISNPNAVTVSLPTTQTPGVNTFDPSTDVMVGKSDVETLSGLPTTDPITLKWVRLVGHADLTFSNMAFDGAETVRKITLTFNDEAKVAGSFSIDIPNRTAGTGDANAIVLEGNGITVSGTSVKAWASVLPTTFTALNVEINTDKATYTRSISGLNKAFVQNRRNILTIKMDSDLAQRTEVEPDRYILYSGDLTEGDYLICYNNGAMKAEVSTNTRLLYNEVSPNENVILNNDPSIVWHISATSGNYWTIYNADVECYAAATGSNNQATLVSSITNDSPLWSASVLNTNTYNIVNKSNSRYLRKNGTNGFACYANGTGGPLSLYKKDTRTRLQAPATVSASVNSSDDHIIDVTFSTVTGAASYVIVATPTNDGNVVTKTGVTSSPATITTTDGLAYSTEYSISVYAIPVNTTQYIESAATTAPGTVTTGAGSLTQQVLFSESFGNNPNKATDWSLTYSVMGGLSEVYSNANETVNAAKVSKNTMGKTQSALVSSQGANTARYIVGPLNVSGCEDLVVTNYYGMSSGLWSSSSFMRCSYSTDGTNYTLLTNTETTVPTQAVANNSHHVLARFVLPAAAVSSTLYLKFEFYCYQKNKNGTEIGQAYFDDVELSGKK